MVKNLKFLAEIESAATRCWEEISADAYQLEGFKGRHKECAELVFDANRIDRHFKNKAALVELESMPYNQILKISKGWFG